MAEGLRFTLQAAGCTVQATRYKPQAASYEPRTAWSEKHAAHSEPQAASYEPRTACNEKRAARSVQRAASIILLFGSAFLFSCEPQLVDDPIPLVAFNDIVLDLDFPENNALRNAGGFRALPRGGVRGIIVYRTLASRFLAFERNCSFRPNDACSTVDPHISGLFMICHCCNSTFDFENGNPTGAPAWRPLLQYRVQQAGSVLTITDEVIN
jgi:nitrite reductase/ring-hydroxylating ferredoxin subunit